MAKITCPHCKAVNQDAAPNDPCWQCGKPLGASAAEPAADGATSSEAGAATAPGPQLAPRTRPEPKIPIEQRYAPVGPNYPVIIISLLVLVAIILAILFALKIIHFQPPPVGPAVLRGRSR